MQTRKILHCDCNSFYASVELLYNPEYKDKPVAVGGDESSRHGIVLAKNELAKKCGVKTAETIRTARYKCPDLIVLPPHHDLYERYSKIVNGIYLHYTDLVEPFGIDESWLDVTNSYHLFADSATQLADMIRQRVYYETGLTISVGASFNKVFAKLGSDYKKPDATTVISPKNFRQIVYPLKVEDMIYVGKTTKDALNNLGVYTIGDLSKLSCEFLVDRFGKHGKELYTFANALDNSPVTAYESEKEVKSVGSGNTFSHNLDSMEEIKPAIMRLSEDVGYRLRKHRVYANGVQISLKDPSFVTFTRQCRIPSTNVTRDIYDTALKLFNANWQVKNPLRAMTVTAIDISVEKRVAQVSLFEENSNDKMLKSESLQVVLDKLREKYGEDTVQNAALIKKDVHSPKMIKNEE